METPATNNTIAFLMASNNEDIAQDLANEITALKLELERVKKLATDRLERTQLKSIELERVKKIAANRLEELTRLKTQRPIRDREREELDAMIAKNNEWLDANDARTVIGEGGLWGAHCRGEI
jgi:hypothetical protein